MAGTVRYQITVGAESYSGAVSYTAKTHEEIVIADEAADTALDLGGITTVDVLVLYSDQALTVNFDADDGTDITLDAGKPLVLAGTAVTAIYVSNDSGSDANLTYTLYGA